MRTLTWQTLDAHLKATFPGQTNKERRSLAEKRIRAMSMAAALSAFQENEFVQKAYQHCVEDYTQKILEVCQNIGRTSGPVIHWETDFLTSVTKSIQVSYLCRKKDCGFYGMNDQYDEREFLREFFQRYSNVFAAGTIKWLCVNPSAAAVALMKERLP